MVWTPAACGGVFLRGRENVLKRMLIHYAALNLGLLLRSKCGHGTPRGFRGPSDVYFAVQMALYYHHLMLETLYELDSLVLTGHAPEGRQDQ